MKSFSPSSLFNLAQAISVSLVTCALFSGCVSSRAIKMSGDFAKTSGTLAEVGEANFNSLKNADEIQQNTTAINHPERSVHKIVGESSGLNNQISLRIHVLESLKQYSEKLKALAESNQKEAVDAAAQDLVQAAGLLNATLAKTSPSYTALSGEQIRLLGWAVAESGKAYLEHQKFLTLSLVMAEINPAYQKVSRLFRSESANFAKDEESLYDTSITNYQQLLGKAVDLGLSPNLVQSYQQDSLKCARAKAGVNGRWSKFAQAMDKAAQCHADLAAALKLSSADSEKRMPEIQSRISDFAAAVFSAESSWRSMQK